MRERSLVRGGGRKGRGGEEGESEANSPAVTREDIAKVSSGRGKLAAIGTLLFS